jgi:predicted nucleotidyltransferase
MTSHGDRTEVLEDLAASVCPDPDVEYVVAFGSQVSGEPTASSDLDLAVKFVDDLSDQERFEKWCFLSGDLQQENAPFVDVADIQSLPLDVAHDVVNGEFVCGDEEAFEQFKREIEAGFSEHRETIRREQRKVIDRIAEDGLRGDEWVVAVKQTIVVSHDEGLIDSADNRIRIRQQRGTNRSVAEPETALPVDL